MPTLFQGFIDICPLFDVVGSLGCPQSCRIVPRFRMDHGAEVSQGRLEIWNSMLEYACHMSGLLKLLRKDKRNYTS